MWRLVTTSLDATRHEYALGATQSRLVPRISSSRRSRGAGRDARLEGPAAPPIPKPGFPARARLNPAMVFQRHAPSQRIPPLLSSKASPLPSFTRVSRQRHETFYRRCQRQLEIYQTLAWHFLKEQLEGYTFFTILFARPNSLKGSAYFCQLPGNCEAGPLALSASRAEYLQTRLVFKGRALQQRAEQRS